jgi:hypothetical protein
MLASIQFYGLGCQTFHLLNQLDINVSGGKKMFIVQPTHMHYARVRTAAVSIRRKVWEV